MIGYISEVNEITISRKYLHSHLYCSIIHKSQGGNTRVHRWIKWIWYAHILEYYLAIKKEENSAFYNNMDGPWRHSGGALLWDHGGSRVRRTRQGGSQHSENEDHGNWSHHFMANRWGNNGNRQTLFWGAPKSLQMVTATLKSKDACSLEEKLWPT